MDIIGRNPCPITAHPASPSGLTAPDADPDAALRKAAQALETSFLSEMLKSAGLGEMPGLTGGGEGEEQFASMLRDEQAKQMVSAGGIGLAEQLFEALKKGQPHA